MRLRLLILLVAVLLVGACSAPLDSGPKPIRTASIPLGLRSQSPSTTSTTVPTGASEEVTVYYINQDRRLQPVKRRVSVPVTAEKVLQKLFALPNEVEASSGLFSAISLDATILHADVKSSILTVDTSRNFAFGSVPEQILAYAQVVFTATELSEVTGVQFAQNGKRISALAGDGSSNAPPLGRASFAQYAPR